MADDKLSKQDKALRRKEVERSGIKYKPDKATMDSPSAASVDVVLNQIKKQYGDGIIMVASQAPATKIRRFWSGVYMIDYALGGGWPRGRVCNIYGKESSGKTTLALKTVAMAQRTCRVCNQIGIPKRSPQLVNKTTGEILAVDGRKNPENIDIPEDHELRFTNDWDNVSCGCDEFQPMKVVWFDPERSYSSDWAAAMGVDNDQVLLAQPEFAEMAMDSIDALMRTGGIDLVVVDSIAMLTPRDEIEASFGNLQVAVLARLVNKFLRKVGSAQSAQGGLNNSSAATVLLVNQLRDTIAPYGPREVQPGGRGLKFATSVEIRLRRLKIRSHQRRGEKHSPAIQIAFQAKKNKTSTPFKEGTYWLWVQGWDDDGIYRVPGDVEDKETVIEMAKDLGLFNQSDDFISFGDRSFETMTEVAEMYDEDWSFASALRAATLKADLEATP